MLKLWGNRKTLCDQVTRRDLLHVGGIGLWGLSLAGLPHTPLTPATAAAAAAQSSSTGDLPGFGRAKRCILIYLFGAAPQHETFDPKPEAPAEIQGEMKAIATSVPGLCYGEGLPQVARIADRLTTIRSMSHPYPLHGVAYALSGLPVYTTDLEVKPHDPAQWPYFGSVADWYWSRGKAQTPDRVLQHVGLPWVLNSQVDDLGLIAGPYGSFLGRQYDPVWAQFQGQPQKVAPKCRHEQTKEYQDPYAACSRDANFVFHGASPKGALPADGQFALRRTLLQQFDESRRALDAAAHVRDFQTQKSRALALLTAPALREALDIGREKPELRERYGYTLFGQSCLAARRLVEAGSRFISVFWDAFGTYFSGGWDTHQNHYPRLKQYLLPGFDAAFAALIEDLEQRGLLDDTLIVCTTEHGRTPQIDSKPAGAARHHWSKAYCTLLAGGGAPRGAVVGRTDRQAGEVMDLPITPKDIQATAFHWLGIPAETQMPDRLGRPLPIAGEGRVRRELL
ncbi:MAG: DUF1501 domain-containing protein [Planctomycetota bacterium]